MSLVPSSPAEPSPPPRQVKRTQEQRRSEAESRLLDAARTIVAHKGWAGMTLGEVGTAAGYSRGLATHHFGSKPELLRALAVHIGQNFTSTFSEASGNSKGFHAVLEFIVTYLGRSGNEWTNTRALLILMAEGMTDATEAGANLAIYNQTVIDFLRRHFDEAIASKEIQDDIDPEAAAIALLGTVRGVMLQSLQKSARIDVSKVTAEILSTTIKAYSRRPQTWQALYLRRRGS